MTVAPRLRDLPGYLSVEQLAAREPPISPEQLVLASYTFLPYVRTGIAAALTEPFSASAPSRASVTVNVPVHGTGDQPPQKTASAAVTVRGPADVLAIDPAQVIRCYPQPGAADALSEDLAHIEFDRPDYPWMFTPAGPAGDRVVPWICLIVVELAPGTPDPLAPAARGRLPTLTTTRAELPPLADAWAWAHAQVMGKSSGDPAGDIASRLSPANPTVNLSRLMCPRQLTPQSSYLACLVPTFRAGVEAGLGLPIKTTTLAPAWNDGDSATTKVTLPVYYSFRFSTGEAGDFKTLAERLVPLPAPAGVGRRRLDTSHPGNGIPDVAPHAGVSDRDVPGREMVVEGPVVSLATASEEDGWPSEADQQWPATQHDELRHQLNAGAVARKAPATAGRPTVGPPLYAGAQIAQDTIDDTAPGWFRELNDDPRNRVVAGLGVRVVEHDREDLMSSAWEQVAGVEAANLALRAAQLGRYVGASLYRRHLSAMAPASLLALTAPVHSRLLQRPGSTIRATVAASSLPVGAIGPSLRRIARPRGPVARFSGATPLARTAAVGRLLTDSAGTTRDYVRQYVNPDGIDGLSKVTMALITPAMVNSAFGSSPDPQATLALHVEALAGPSFTDALASGALATLDPAVHADPGTAAANALEKLLIALPARDALSASPQAAAVGRAVAGQLDAIVATGSRWRISGPVAARWRMTGAGQGQLATVTGDQVAALAATVRTLTPDHAQFEDPVTALRLEHALSGASPAAAGALRDDLSLLASRLIAAAESPSDGRDRVSVPELDLLAKLDPAKTVPSRMLGRLMTTPSWLDPNWLANGRIDQVMVAPSFSHPMYEALDRYDRDWLIPGIGKIAEHDIVTLLASNSRFVEAFLVGLNHEMGRELLWREYPTDGRGTCFRSFWTATPELSADVNAFDPALPLGGHMKPTLDGRIVMLVRGELIRRYPGLLAHAVPQASIKDGWPTLSNPVPSLFQINLAPNMLLVGFDLKTGDVESSDSGAAHSPPDGAYWFLLAENPTEPRFGLNDASAGAAPNESNRRDDVTWADLPPENGFLRPSGGWAVLDGPPPPDPSSKAVRWGTDAAAVAHILYRPPERAAFRATSMIKP